MISNFDQVKSQLSELSEVINKFKSEAVQLRIVEIVLSGGSFGSVADTNKDEPATAGQKSTRKRKTRSRGGAKISTANSGENAPTKPRPVGRGPGAALSNLVENGFFSSPKTLNDIVSHCEHKLAQRFKSSEFSGKLARLTRDGVLDRNKNGDGQYEYTKK